jgi:hypothetical protein
VNARLWGLLALAVLSLGAAGWIAVASAGDEAREELHVIPKGTWARRAAGEKLDTFPSDIHLTLGLKDVLVLKNNDDVPQMFGPVLMMPGQTFRLPFAVAARHDFACTAHVNGQLSVHVAPRPAWWQLVPLRAAAVVKSLRWS